MSEIFCTRMCQTPPNSRQESNLVHLALNVTSDGIPDNQVTKFCVFICWSRICISPLKFLWSIALRSIHRMDVSDRHNGEKDKETNERTDGRTDLRTDGRQRDVFLCPSVCSFVRLLDGVWHYILLQSTSYCAAMKSYLLSSLFCTVYDISNRNLFCVYFPMQSVVGLRDLGQFHRQPFKDSSGNVVLVAVRHVTDTKNVNKNVYVHWTPVDKLQPSTSLGFAYDSDTTAFDIVAMTVPVRSLRTLLLFFSIAIHIRKVKPLAVTLSFVPAFGVFAFCQFKTHSSKYLWIFFMGHPVLAGWVRVPVTCRCWHRPRTVVPRRRLPSIVSLTDRHLRSADIRTCVVPRTNTRFEDRSFSNSGPKIWNSLRSACRQPGLNFAVFKQHLESYLFNAILERGA